MEHKSFIIERKPQSSLYHIRLTGGGSVPSVLSGAFTTVKLCQDAIDRFQRELSRQHDEAIARREKRSKSQATQKQENKEEIAA